MVGVIYRHPKSNLYDFKSKLEKSIENLNKNKTMYTFCGHINIDLLKNDLFVADFLDSFLSLGCNQHVNSPTRIALNGTSQTLLDHVYSNFTTNM